MTAPADVQETPTFQGLVPTWEIDLNDHWNTSFYMRAFQHAAERFAMRAGRPAPGEAAATGLGGDSVRARHVRFFREMRAGDSLRVFTTRLPAARAPYNVLHMMRHGTTGALCASALDMVAAAPLPGAPVAAEVPGDILPRSLSAGPAAPAASADLLARGVGALTQVGVLRPADFDHSGALMSAPQYFRIADGVAHLWQHVGVTPQDFRSLGLGRAIVELKLTRHAAARPGDVIRAVSWFSDIGTRSFSLSHQLENLVTGEVLANSTAVTMVLDMETRRAAPLPPFLTGALAAVGLQGAARA